MSKRTPGPWKFFEGSVTIGVARNHPETGDYALIATMCSSRPEAAANGRLLAAAPDLLDACKLAEEYFRNPSDAGSTDRIIRTTVLITRLRAAVAIAEGKE